MIWVIGSVVLFLIYIALMSEFKKSEPLKVLKDMWDVGGDSVDAETGSFVHDPNKREEAPKERIGGGGVPGDYREWKAFFERNKVAILAGCIGLVLIYVIYTQVSMSGRVYKQMLSGSENSISYLKFIDGDTVELKIQLRAYDGSLGQIIDRPEAFTYKMNGNQIQVYQQYGGASGMIYKLDYDVLLLNGVHFVRYHGFI